MAIRILCSFFKLGCLSFYCWVVAVLYIFQILVFCQMYDLQSLQCPLRRKVNTMFTSADKYLEEFHRIPQSSHVEGCTLSWQAITRQLTEQVISVVGFRPQFQPAPWGCDAHNRSVLTWQHFSAAPRVPPSGHLGRWDGPSWWSVLTDMDKLSGSDPKRCSSGMRPGAHKQPLGIVLQSPSLLVTSLVLPDSWGSLLSPLVRDLRL